MAESIDGVDSFPIPADDIRDVLLRAMVMGMPEEVEHRATFWFVPDLVVDGPVDHAGQPVDWSSPVVSGGPRSEQVICTVEFSAPIGRQASVDTAVGQFTPSTLVLTFFEEQFETVRGFQYVTVGPDGDRWFPRVYQPPVGLGGLTVFQLICGYGEPK